MAGVVLYEISRRYWRPLSGRSHTSIGVGDGAATSNTGVPHPLPGASVREAVRLVERTAKASRIYSLSMSVPRERSDGRPSSLSTVIDQLAFGRPGKQRYFCTGGQYR